MKKDRRERLTKAKRRKTDPVVMAWFMVLVLIIIVGIMMYVDFQRRSLHDPFATPPPGRFQGNPNGELKITQFLDFRSPECALGQNIIKDYMARRPGEIFVQTRYFPMDDESIAAAVYAECANRQKAFWRFTDLVFQRQSRWVDFPGREAVLKSFAADLGLDLNAFNECVARSVPSADIIVDRSYGESLFVRSTPSYFINGRLVVGVEALKNALQLWDKQLNEDD